MYIYVHTHYVCMCLYKYIRIIIYTHIYIQEARSPKQYMFQATDAAPAFSPPALEAPQQPMLPDSPRSEAHGVRLGQGYNKDSLGTGSLS